VRFAVAKQQGLDETKVAQIDDGHAQSDLPDRLKLALAFADAFFAAGGPPPVALQEALVAEFGDEALVEMAIGLALFHGVAKLLITLGGEPEQMDITELRTPGS
jgi:alkylhydroperoxidase family enzyme